MSGVEASSNAGDVLCGAAAESIIATYDDNMLAASERVIPREVMRRSILGASSIAPYYLVD